MKEEANNTKKNTQNTSDSMKIKYKNKDTLDIKFNFSHKKDADIFWEQVANIFKNLNYSDLEIKKLFIVSQELITNASKYGNGGMASVRISPKQVILIVKDMGSGFNVKEELRKKPEENISIFLKNCLNDQFRENKFGCGLFLAEKYSDYFFYNKQGNILISVIKRGDSR